MASRNYSYEILNSDYEYPISRNKIIQKIKDHVLKLNPKAIFDQEPYFKEIDSEMGILNVPYFVKENCKYEIEDQVIIDTRFQYYSILGNSLNTLLQGSRLIDIVDNNTINDHDDFIMLIQFDLCRNHLFEILKSVIEIYIINPNILRMIKFTKSDKLRYNSFGGRTLLYLTYDNLLTQSIGHLSTSEYINSVDFLDIEDLDELRDYTLVTDDKIFDIIYSVNTELSKQKRNIDFWDSNRKIH